MYNVKWYLGSELVIGNIMGKRLKGRQSFYTPGKYSYCNLKSKKTLDLAWPCLAKNV